MKILLKTMSKAANFRGTLQFTVFQVKELPENCDPYVKITVGGSSVRTETQRDCSYSAEFNQTLSISLYGSEDDAVIQLMDWDRWKVFTSGSVPLTTIISDWQRETQPMWISLDSGSKKCKLLLDVKFSELKKGIW
jgi:hypothetical protein